MSKIIKILLSTTIICSLIFVGCSNNNKGINVDKPVEKTVEVKSVSDQKYSNKVDFKQYGFKFYVNDMWKDYIEKGLLYIDVVNDFNEAPVYFVTSDDLEKSKKENGGIPTPERYQKSLLSIKVVDKKNDSTKANENELAKKYGKKEKLGEAGNFEYYIWYNDKFDSTNLSEKSKKEIEEAIQGIDYLKKNIEMFEPVDPAKELEKLKTFEFKGKTTKGEDVDESIFKDYTVTMIHIWKATKSNESELNKIQQFYDSFKDKGVNVIGIVLNGDENENLTKAVINSNWVKFTNIVLDKKYLDRLDKALGHVPMKIFVDNKGNIIGPATVGENYKEQLGKVGKILKEKEQGK